MGHVIPGGGWLHVSRRDGRMLTTPVLFWTVEDMSVTPGLAPGLTVQPGDAFIHPDIRPTVSPEWALNEKWPLRIELRS